MDRRRLTHRARSVGWFLCVAALLGVLYGQLPMTSLNQGILFVVAWMLVVPVISRDGDVGLWRHTFRALLGGVAVAILSEVRTRTVGDERFVPFQIITLAILVIAVAGMIRDARRNRQHRT